MTNAQGGSPFENWQNACAEVRFQQEEYEKIVKKESKSAQNKLDKLNKLKASIPELEKNKDDINLSDTALSTVIEVYAQARHHRREDMTNKFLEKGNRREDDAITLLSRVLKRFFKKNAIRLNNEYVTGEPDIFIGNIIEEAEETLDTKSSWSYITFLKAWFLHTQFGKINPIYYWQGQAYMWLTGAKKHTICYCLVNGTAQGIMDEKKKAYYQIEYIFEHLDENARLAKYAEKCRQIEINHIFDLQEFRKENPYFDFDNDVTTWDFDIPLVDRVYTISFDRNEEDIERLRLRIIDCRKYMDKHLFKVKMDPINLRASTEQILVDNVIKVVEHIFDKPESAPKKKEPTIEDNIKLLEKIVANTFLSKIVREEAANKLVTIKKRFLNLETAK